MDWHYLPGRQPFVEVGISASSIGALGWGLVNLAIGAWRA
jgi:hypothetical protein